MAKIGVVCDNYKVQKFEEEFNKKGIKFSSAPFTKFATLFTCESEQNIIQPIVDNVTQFFIDKYTR